MAADASRLLEAAARLADEMRALPQGTRFLLDADSDADGLCAAAIIYRALRHIGHAPRIQANREKTTAHYEGLLAEPGALVLLDKGTSHVATLARHRHAFVIDHHHVPSGVTPVRLLNPRALGMDGSRDASSSTTAFALALAIMGEASWPLAATALCGAIGDFQHLHGWHGWNRYVRDEALQRGHVTQSAQPLFIGVTLADALTHARPPVPGLEGDRPAAVRFLVDIGIDADAEVEDLPPDARTRLVSAVLARHLAAGTPDAELQLVEETDMHPGLGTSLRHVFRMIDACGRRGRAGIGIAALLGDDAAQGAARLEFTAYKQALADALGRLAKDPPVARQALQFAWTPQPEYTGMVAGLGVTHLVADRSRPLVILARRPDGQVQVSTRARDGLEAKGLDLAIAVSGAARHVGREGGGHPIAAGAIVAEGDVEPFLARLDELLVAQAFRGAA